MAQGSPSSPGEIQPRQSGRRHRQAILSSWPLGVVTTAPSVSLPLGALVDAYGFVVNDFGKLETEPVWKAFLLSEAERLPDNYEVRGVGIFYRIFEPSGEMGGVYYLNAYNFDRERNELYLIVKRTGEVKYIGDINGPDGEPFTGGVNCTFAVLSQKCMMGVDNQNLQRIIDASYGDRNIEEPADYDLSGTSITYKTIKGHDTGVRVIPQRAMVVHQSRLWIAGNVERALTWSDRDDPETFRDISRLALPAEVLMGQSETLTGIEALIRLDNLTLLLGRENELLQASGYPPANLKVIPVATGGNSNFPITKFWQPHAVYPVFGLSNFGYLFRISRNGIEMVDFPLRNQRRAIWTGRGKVALDSHGQWLYLSLLSPTYSDMDFWNEYAVNWPILPPERATDGRLHGWVMNMNNGAWTRTSYLNHWSEYTDEDTNQQLVNFSESPMVASLADLNSERTLRFFNQKRIMFRDAGPLQAMPSVYYEPYETDFHGEPWGPHYIQFPDYDFGTPTQYKHLTELHIRACPTNPQGDLTYFNVYVRYDLGPWQLVYRQDTNENASSPNWPVDNFTHRGRHPGPPWRYLGIRITYQPGNDAQQGMMLDYIKVLYSEWDPAKT